MRRDGSSFYTVLSVHHFDVFFVLFCFLFVFKGYKRMRSVIQNYMRHGRSESAREQ